jgi:GxxExxY protein
MTAEELNRISGQVVDAAIAIHSELGPGLLESVYEVVLAHELRRRELTVDRQVAVPIEFRGIRFEEAYRIDLLVGGTVVVEIKSIEELLPVHHKQVLTYLRLTKRPLGLLLNFNCDLMKHGITRIANNAPR